MAGGLEPPHGPFPLTRRLMGVLHPIVQIAVLPVFHTGHDLARGGTVALGLVRDDHPWDIPAPFEELAEEFLGCSLIPPALHQDIKHVPLLIHRPPQIMAFALNGQEHLIQVPLIPGLWPSVSKLIGVGLPDLLAPFPDRFIRHDDATGK
jgi:hypothetical protein